MLKRILFHWRLFRNQFHPITGINIIHQKNERGFYECSYLILTKNPFSSDALLKIKYDRREVDINGRITKWIKRLV